MEYCFVCSDELVEIQAMAMRLLATNASVVRQYAVNDPSSSKNRYVFAMLGKVSAPTPRWRQTRSDG